MSNDLGLGKIITGNAQRDAIHVAIAPIKAPEKLFPGQAVDEAGSPHGKPVGIVDPFLSGPVFPEQKCWLFLYPNTVTSLRHDWTHPAFDGTDTRKVDSEKWLREFAVDVCIDYDELLDAARRHVDRGDYHILDYDTPDRAYSDIEKFWEHYEIVTGKKVEDRTATFISCAC